MHFLKWAAPAIALLLLAGCHDLPHQTLRKRPYHIRNVVSLSPSTSELAIMTLQVRLDGRGESDNYPANVTSYPVVMNGIHPDFEAIAQTHPGAVLYDLGTINPSDIAKLKQMGLVTIGIGGNSYDDYKKTLYEAGSELAAESYVSDYVQGNIDRNIQQAKAALGNKPVKVAVVMPGKGSEHMIAGTNSFQADMLKRIGATPVGPDATNFVRMNAEDFIKEDPDVILVAGHPDNLAADPRLASMRAIKGNHMAGLYTDVVLREGCRVDQLVQDMGNAIVRVRP